MARSRSRGERAARVAAAGNRPRGRSRSGQDAQLCPGPAVRVLYLYCHPLPESFHAGIRVEALAGLKTAGHQVDLLDLYAEGFDPILSEEGRRPYHDESRNRRGLEPLVARLQAAGALVIQLPTW